MYPSQPPTTTYLSLPSNFYMAAFLESGRGHIHLALLDTDEIGMDPDTSDTQILETEEK
jgi:hypothetical protein